MFFKHGMTKTPEYAAWRSMRARCVPGSRYSEYHGQRGIKVCCQWQTSFESFFAEVGLRPSPRYSLDRYPDNDGDYKPGNVRWATPYQQMVNQRRTHKLKNGVPIIAVVRKNGLNENTVRWRLRAGWTPDQAISVPIRGRAKISSVMRKQIYLARGTNAAVAMRFGIGETTASDIRNRIPTTRNGRI